MYVGRPLVRYRTDTAKVPRLLFGYYIRDTIKVPRDFNSRPAPRQATVDPQKLGPCNMSEYRIYGVGGDGHLIDGQNIECADDQEATKRPSERLADLLTLSYEPMLAWRLDGVIEFWNAGAERLSLPSGPQSTNHLHLRPLPMLRMAVRLTPNLFASSARDWPAFSSLRISRT